MEIVSSHPLKDLGVFTALTSSFHNGLQIYVCGGMMVIFIYYQREKATYGGDDSIAARCFNP